MHRPSKKAMNRRSRRVDGLRLVVLVGLLASCHLARSTLPPNYDGDGDGFLDGADTCANEPGVAPDGCPIPDTDADGILDSDDKCPKEPEIRNGYDDEDGCPDEIPVALTKYTAVIKGIYFDLDKDTIKPKSRPVLDRAVQVLKEFPTIQVEVSCHESRYGGLKRAQAEDLTQRRAINVKAYLVEQGISSERIVTRGAGWYEPVDNNKKAAGRAKNRRCDFIVLNPGGFIAPSTEEPGLEMVRGYDGPLAIDMSIIDTSVIVTDDP